MNFKSTRLKEFMDLKGLLVDVRSPEEYYKGHMPNSINIPLFNNEERAFIGKKYKNAGREKAVFEGLKIVEKRFDQLIGDIVAEYKKYNHKTKSPELNSNVKVYCARGGMRSISINWLLEKIGYKSFKLEGGYKSYRNWVLNCFFENRNITLIGGKTGTGKTKILKKLIRRNYQVIDLEYLANHRGSSFGGLGMKSQPTNEQFENMLAEKLINFSGSEQIFIEAESANIGSCRIPHEFFKQMKNAKRIEILQSKKNRINELISTYSIFPKNDLKNSVIKISKRLGPQRTKKAIEAIENENWEDVCNAVLEYYDKCYEYELANNLKVRSINIEDKKDNEIIELITKESY
tara:strand:+ start:100 stop:1143 length:1044 start_codon:yes stop_codon:yes gene_type:complete